MSDPLRSADIPPAPAPLPDPVLSVRRLSRVHGSRQTVDRADLDLHAGRIACLLGPSGCGKSTLLRMIAGLEPADEGEIVGGIGDGSRRLSAPGFTVPPEARGVGLVFQDAALFPHLTVADNIGFGLKGTPKAERARRVDALIARFHLERLARAWPHTLSGGEQQRVAIARALAREPAVLLLDEPFSGLDGPLRAAVRESVLADLRGAGAAVLIVTHDPEEALRAADDLILMAEGRILQSGPPDDCYLNPVSVEAARLLGEALVLPARVAGGVARSAFGTVAAPGLADGPARLMVRPEGLVLRAPGAPDDGAAGRASAPVPAVVAATGFAGPFSTVTLDAGNGDSATLRMAGPPPAPGSTALVAIDPARARVYPA